ncbi:MAG: micrococcal nuclease [Actinomycetota bacterium]|nr:micrococcal nuclease [Actinomycetota bacterium]
MSTRRGLAAVGAVVLTLLAGVAVAGNRHAEAGRPGTVRIVRVVDGDTVVAHLGGTDERVRLIGIDTPETVDPRKPVQCFGREASDRTKALLPKGMAVRLERDVEARDRYGRLLAYVYRADDGTFVNLALAEEGFAQPLTIPPNVAYADRFAAAAAGARTAGRGLWSACK